METALTLLFWSAIGFAFLSTAGLIVLRRVRSRMQDDTASEAKEGNRGKMLRGALGGLADAIGSMF